MRLFRCLLVLAPAVLLSACSRTEPAKNQADQQKRGSAAFGMAGTMKNGEYEGRVPFFQKGDLMVYLPQSAFPGKPLSPAYVLIARLADGTRLYQGGLSGANDFLEISPTMLDSRGRAFRFQYTVNIDDHGKIIRGKPPVEAFRAGGQHYNPEAGRVFLVNLTADPPAVSQVRVDLAGVLAHLDRDPSQEQMQAAVKQLASEDEAVRDFLAACNTE